MSLLADAQTLQSGEPQAYTITQTWDNNTAVDKPEVKLTFSSSRDELKSMNGLLITVDAPFYNNKLPDSKPGFVEGLWNFEVVEVFFLGQDEKYLEIELGPGGHYLTYFLEGVRNVTKNDLPIDFFDLNINKTTMRWTGSAVIPLEYLPLGVNKFNAYAIHDLNSQEVVGADGERRYLSLFPVPTGVFDGPNFHRLEYFGDIDLSKIINNVTPGVATS